MKKRTKCSVCAHRERAAVDLGLVRGVSVSALAKKYGLGADSIYRHKANHLPPQLKAALVTGHDLGDIDLDKLRADESQSLLANIVSVRNRLLANLDAAEEHQDINMFTRVAAELRQYFELMGRLLGELAVGSVTNVSVLVMPEYIELRVALVQALSSYPEAKLAVAQVLHQLESKAAADIKPKEFPS